MQQSQLLYNCLPVVNVADGVGVGVGAGVGVGDAVVSSGIPEKEIFYIRKWY